MTPAADLDRRQLWPCRPPAELRKQLKRIMGIENLSKTGVITFLLARGIEAYLRMERERDAVRQSGLSIGAILPFLDYGGDPADKSQVRAAEEYFRKYHTGGIRHRV